MTSAGVNGVYTNGRGSWDPALSAAEARRSRRDAQAHRGRPIAPEWRLAQEEEDWIAAYSPSAPVAVDHWWNRLLGRLGVDRKLPARRRGSAEADHRLIRIFYKIGLFVLYAHLFAVGWVVIWELTRKMMGH